MATVPSGDNLGRSRSVSGDGRVPPIYGLATEVVVQILACLDSDSLSSALLAHSMFYATFQAYPQQILKEILLRLIPPQLLHLAFATYEAASMNYSDWSVIRRILDPLHVGQFQASCSSTGLLSRPLTRRMVAEIERIHRMARYFTIDFARQAIPRFSRLFEITRPATSSQSEEIRILRAFYRFQLYCNIFGRKAIESVRQANLTAQPDETGPRQTLPRMSPEDMQRELACFFWPWPPWVNEQLACVFEYLETIISVFFDDVASHDIEWGWRQVDWVEPTEAIPHRRFLLFSGLGLPYQLRQSDAFEIWKTLLDSADVCRAWHTDDWIVTMASSLTESVAPKTVTHADDVPMLLGRYNIGQLRELEGRATWKGIDDAETLPVELWRLANINNHPRASVLARTNLTLRDAGYVFWDGHVGEAAEVLDRVEACSWTFTGRVLPHELPKLRHAMRRSWRKRSKIWSEGGVGYWADGDESRVRYKSDP